MLFWIQKNIIISSSCVFGKGDVDLNIRVDSDKDVDEDAELASMDENVIKIVEQAWDGRSGVSRIYRDETLGPQYVCLCGAGLCRRQTGRSADCLTEHGCVLGCAGKYVDLGGEGYIHLISDSGRSW